jgi:outer membrane receptor protein involved in Fe transport
MRDRRYLGLFSFNFLRNPVAGLTLDVFGNWQYRRYQDPEFYLGGIDDTHDNATVGTDLNLNRLDDFSILSVKSVAGYSFRYDRLISSGLIKASGGEGEGKVARQSHGAFLRNEVHLFPFEAGKQGRILLFPAFRFDSNRVVSQDDAVDKNEHAFSWNIGCMAPFSEEREVILKGTLGTAYRLPSFDDLFWPSTAFAVGNPNLLPEEAFNYDVGIIFSPYDFFSFEVAHFSSDVTNLIQWNPGANGQWQPSNIGKALLNGLEGRAKFLFEVPFIASYLEFEGNYTYLFAKDMVEGSATYSKQLPRRPFERANVIGTLSHADGHSIRLQGRYIGYRYITAQNTKYLPSVFLLDTTLRVNLWKHATITGSVKNVLNVSYVDVREYPVPGRELSISGSVRL